ncbi:MAG: hypothetical protein NVSMB51_10620 [Solirubrobacteraceae bacterium]
MIVLLTGLAGLARYGGWSSLTAFALATLALAGLAWIVSFSTEQVGERFGPGITGLMQATLGNLPELFVVIFALDAGESVVAQTSIVGSLFANALLVLGTVFVVGARASNDGVMHFAAKLTSDAATLLLVEVFIIVLVGLSLASGDPASHHVKSISVIAAVSLLVVYLAWVVPYARRDAAPRSHGRARIDARVAIAMLVIAGLGSAFVSDWFIAALKPSIAQLHVSQAFAGIVIVAIAGNAVEHFAGVVLAAKGRSDLAISVVVNSVAQIAAFLFPLLVLISLLLPTTLTFALSPIYIGALALTAIAIWQVTNDGEGHPFEGWALIATYVILAAITAYE